MSGYATTLKRFLIATGFAIFVPVLNLEATGLGLLWDANSEEDLAGYRIYISTKSLLTTTTAQARSDKNIGIWEVGKTTATDVQLVGGTTYYFRATAFDESRNESGFNIKLSSGTEMEDEVSVFIKRSDINSDGKVNVIDLSILAKELE